VLELRGGGDDDFDRLGDHVLGLALGLRAAGLEELGGELSEHAIEQVLPGLDPAMKGRPGDAELGGDRLHVDALVGEKGRPSEVERVSFRRSTEYDPPTCPRTPASGRRAPVLRHPPQSRRRYRPVNQCHFTDPFFQAAGYPLQSCPNTPALTLYPTRDAAYITAYVDRRFGPAPGGHNVVVMTGQMPTTPATQSGDPYFTGRTSFATGACAPTRAS
jgi:hypothetical protein